MRIDYTVQIWKEGDQFVAHALPIDVVSSGHTPDEARSALAAAVRLFLSTARLMGTLEDVLEESSYRLQDGVWQAPEWVALERQSTLLSA